MGGKSILYRGGFCDSYHRCVSLDSPHALCTLPTVVTWMHIHACSEISVGVIVVEIEAHAIRKVVGMITWIEEIILVLQLE